MKKCIKQVCTCALLVFVIRCTMLLPGAEEELRDAVEQEFRSVKASVREFATAWVPYDGWEVLQEIRNENCRIRFYTLDKLVELKNIFAAER